jgi:hypothetical protein
MRFTCKLWANALLILCALGNAVAQQQINPAKQIDWPRIALGGTPTAEGFTCGMLNYGMPFLQTNTNPNVQWICGTYGWAQNSGGSGSGTVSAAQQYLLAAYTGAGSSTTVGGVTLAQAVSNQARSLYLLGLGDSRMRGSTLPTGLDLLTQFAAQPQFAGTLAGKANLAVGGTYCNGVNGMLTQWTTQGASFTPGFSGTTGTTATVNITASGGGITSATVASGGTQYVAGNIIAVTYAGAANGWLQAATVNGSGAITSLTVYQPGTGYPNSGSALATTGPVAAGNKVAVLIQEGINGIGLGLLAEEACYQTVEQDIANAGMVILPSTSYYSPNATDAIKQSLSFLNDWIRQEPYTGMFTATQLPMVYDFDATFPPEAANPYFNTDAASGSATTVAESVDSANNLTVTIAGGGTGYSVGGPYSTTTNGAGTGAQVSITAVNGSGGITNGSISPSGSGTGTGYSVGDLLYPSGAGGTGGYFRVAQVYTGYIETTSNLVGGTGYTTANGVATTSTPPGSGLTVTIVASGGAITSCSNPTSSGANYVVGNIVAVVQTGASSGECQVNGVSGGVPTSLAPAGTGATGYTSASGLSTTDVPTGTTATMNLVASGGVLQSGTVVFFGGNNYLPGDVIKPVQSGGSGGSLTVATTGSSVIVSINAFVPNYPVYMYGFPTNSATGSNCLNGQMVNVTSSNATQMFSTATIPATTWTGNGIGCNAITSTDVGTIQQMSSALQQVNITGIHLNANGVKIAASAWAGQLGPALTGTSYPQVSPRDFTQTPSGQFRVLGCVVAGSAIPSGCPNNSGAFYSINPSNNQTGTIFLGDAYLYHPSGSSSGSVYYQGSQKGGFQMLNMNNGFEFQGGGGSFCVYNASIGGGTGYSTTTGAATTAVTGSGTGLTANITAAYSTITAFAVNNGGSGYATGDLVAITGGGGSGGEAVVTASGGVVTSLAVLTGCTQRSNTLQIVSNTNGDGGSLFFGNAGYLSNPGGGSNWKHEFGLASPGLQWWYNGSATGAAVTNAGQMYSTSHVMNEVSTAPTGIAFYNVDYTDSTTHRPKFITNLNTLFRVGIASAATSGHCAEFATNGYDLIDAGSACGSGGGGGGTVTSVSFTGDGVLLSSTPSSPVTSSGTLAAALASQSANTTLAAVSVGNPSWVSLPSCSAAGSALQWLSGTGYQCNTSITAAAAPASGLTGTSLPSGITGSSLTGLGTIATGVWQGTAIGKTYIGGQAGSGAGLTTGPTTSTSGDVATFNGTSGQIQDSGTALSAINPCIATSHDASAFSLSGANVSQKASSINIPANCITTSGMLTVSATCVATVAASQTASTFTPLFYFYDNTGSSEKVLTTGTATASVAASSSTEITLTGMVLVPYATQPGYYITGGQVMNAPGGSSTSILGGLANAGSGSAYLVYGSTGNRIDAYFATSVANSTANTIQCTWAIHS